MGYDRLRAQLDEKVVLIKALRKMQEGETAAELPTPNGNAMPWAARVDEVLIRNKGKRISPRTIVEELGGKGNRFPGMKTPADIMIRSTLRGYSDKFGWKMVKKGNKTLWWKEATQ